MARPKVAGHCLHRRRYAHLHSRAGARSAVLEMPKSMSGEVGMLNDWLDIETLLRELALPPGKRLPSGADESVIREMEISFGRKVPDELRALLTISNGPCVGAGGIFGFATADQHLDIKFYWSIFPAWRERGWIPVAGDGCGNYYVLVTGREFGAIRPVIFVEASVDADSGAYIAASGLRSFCKFYLKAGTGEKRWPYGDEYVIEHDPDVLRREEIALPWE